MTGLSVGGIGFFVVNQSFEEWYPNKILIYFRIFILVRDLCNPQGRLESHGLSRRIGSTFDRANHSTERGRGTQ